MHQLHRWLLLQSLVSVCACTRLVGASTDPDARIDPEQVGSAPWAVLQREAAAIEPAAILVEGMRDAAESAAAEAAMRLNAPAWLEFFDPAAVHEVRVTLSAEARSDLNDAPRIWVPATVDVDGRVFTSAGLHLKGNSTFQGMSQKPSFKIKLDEYGGGERLAGVQRLTLNNMVSDPAQAREVLATRLWWALGVPAPRASWARVWINEVEYGLYSNLESVDDEWLARRYRNPGGDLWEANDDADFTEEGLPSWELASGVGNVSFLDTVVEQLEDTSSAALAERVGTTVDLAAFQNYWAACLVTGSTDGYPFHLNDAFVYSDPGDAGRLDFVPWSMDEAWGDSFSTWAEGVLGGACSDDPACERALGAEVDRLLDEVERLDLGALVDATFAVSAPLLRDDDRRPYLITDVELARSALRLRVVGWPAYLRTELGLVER